MRHVDHRTIRATQKSLLGPIGCFDFSVIRRVHVICAKSEYSLYIRSSLVAKFQVGSTITK